MKKMKIILCISMVFVLLSGSMVFADTNTLNKEQVIETTLKNSPQMLTYQHIVDNLEFQYKNAVTNKNETADYLASYTRYHKLSIKSTLTEAEQQEYNRLKFMFQKPLTDDDLYQIRINGELRLDNSEYSLMMQKNNMQNLKNNLVINTINAYNGVLKAQDSISLKNYQLQNVEQTYKNAIVKSRLGMVSLIELTSLELNMKKEQLALKKLMLQKEKAKSTLQKAIQLADLSTYTDCKDYVINDNDITLENQDYYINLGLKNSPDILLAEKKRLIAQKSYDIAVDVYHDESNINTIETEYNLKQADNDLDLLKINIESALGNAYKTAYSAYMQTQGAKVSYELALAKNNETKKNYELGRASSLELSTSNTSLLEKKIAYANAKRDFLVAKSRLQAACGETLY